MKTLILVILGHLMSWTPAYGMTQDEVAQAKERLKRQIQLIDSIQEYVERQDLPRLYVLRSSSEFVLEALNNPSLGLGHKTTFQRYQKLIVSYRFSVSYWQTITTKSTEKSIAELIQLAEETAKVFGFDDSPYTQITQGVYEQMEKLMKQITTLPIRDELKVKIADVLPKIGEVIAISRAKRGDRRTVYPVAEKAFTAIKDLYNDFYALSASDSAFNLAIEIQGLNEFYGEFAEFDDGEEEK